MGLFAQEAGGEKVRDLKSKLATLKTTVNNNFDEVASQVPSVADARTAVLADPLADATADNAAIWAEVDAIAASLQAKITGSSVATQVLLKRIYGSLTYPDAP